MVLSIAFVVSLFGGLALGQVIKSVLVGGNGLAYDPPYVTAESGDTILFEFVADNHTVTQSTFESPCTNLSDTGIDSGFRPADAGVTTFNLTLTDDNASDPLWFYCRQIGHCELGMVFAVNPTAQKTFQAFQIAAIGSSISLLPTVVPSSLSSAPSSSNTSSAASSLASSESLTSSAPTSASSSSVNSSLAMPSVTLVPSFAATSAPALGSLSSTEPRPPSTSPIASKASRSSAAGAAAATHSSAARVARLDAGAGVLSALGIVFGMLF